MKENKKTVAIILIISSIIIVLLILFALKNGLFNKKEDTNKDLVLCTTNIEEKCIYYNKGNFKIIRDKTDYYINDNLVGNYKCMFNVEKDIDNNYLIINTGCNNLDDFKIYNKEGKVQVFDAFNDFEAINYYEYNSNVLTLRSSYNMDSLTKDEACKYKPLNTIAYLEQTIDYVDGKFEEPMTTSTIELVDYLRYFYNIDCLSDTEENS